MRWSWVPTVLLVAAMANQRVLAEQILFFDFNDNSNTDIAKDSSGNSNDGELVEADYTGPGGGVSGADDDYALDLGDFDNGAYLDLTDIALDGAFDSMVDNDRATIAFWLFGNDEQPVNQWTFWFGPGRQLGSHAPWGDGTVYFDVAGCCGANQRIAKNIPDPDLYSGQWNHFAFVKDEGYTAVYINGELFHDSGADEKDPLFEITEAAFGADSNGTASHGGLMDNIGVWDEALDEDAIKRLMSFDMGPTVAGDFNNNGMRDTGDLDLLATAMQANDLALDLNNDGTTNIADRVMWVEQLSNTFMGDSNFDGEFNSSDFVTVFSAGKYESGQAATWAQGDWSGDGQFNSSDFVTAFAGGGYEIGTKPGGLQVVPEPSSLVLLAFGAFALLGQRRTR
ncbi:MAG: PEP-CTERM sorting domain-containing protein [Planctomycetales bacterium]|nr:PEP-CTERM sorting domain-containing protein [Planctomycetales bacterium]